MTVGVAKNQPNAMEGVPFPIITPPRFAPG